MEYVEIRELGEIITGKTPPTENQSFYDGDYPFITPTDIDSFDKRYLHSTERTLSLLGAKKVKSCKLPAKSICFVCIGSTIGKMCMTNCESYTNQQINSIIPNDKCDSDYLFYMLRHINEYFRSIGAGTGSGKGIVNKTVFSKTKIQINKEKQQQKKIADILSAYDELIENNNKRIKILEQMAENLYKEWFAYDKVKGTSQVVRLKEILQIVRGLSYSSEEIEVEEGSNLINLKNIQSFGGFRRDGTKLYGGKYKQEQVVNYGDLVMGVTDMTQDRRTVGSVALIPKINGVSVISADLIKIDSRIDNSFLYAMFKYGNVSKYISQFANGANVLHLRPHAVLNIKILLPPQNMIDRYVDFVKPLFEEIEELNQKNENLTKQRDMLLPRLMSGKLKIKQSQEKFVAFKPKLTFAEFKSGFAAAARKDSGLTAQDMEELYKAYCDDSRDE